MSGGTAGVLSLPTELTEEVLILVHAQRDLLSLALTCSALHSIIVPRHLHYRVIVASESHTPFWAFLLTRPDLARNIRQLTLYNRTEAAHASLKGRQNIRLPPSFQMMDGLSALFALRGTAVWNYEDVREFGRTTFAGALRNMSRLKTIVIRAGGTVIPEETNAGRDLLSLVCRSVPTIETLRVTWCRAIYAPEFFELLPYQATALHPLFSMHALRTLEFPDMWMNTEMWPSFCDMLSLSPQLRSLSLPVFVSIFNPGGTMIALNTEMPYLPYLKRLTVPPAMANSDIQDAILAMLVREPPVTELRWGCTIGLPALDQPFPKLPALRILQETDPFFVIRFLQERPASSVRLRVLDCVGFYIEPLLLIDALRALDFQALRRLHISCLDSMRTLRMIAHMFPMLEELVLPGWCGWTRPGLVTRTARTMWRAISLATLRSAPTRMDWRRMSIHKALTLFPKLCAIHSVDTGDLWLNQTGGRDRRRHPQEPPVGAAKTVSALRKRYPRLLSVNGWTLEPPKNATSPPDTFVRVN